MGSGDYVATLPMSRFEEGRSLMPTLLIDGDSPPRPRSLWDAALVWTVGLLLVGTNAEGTRGLELPAPRIVPGPSRPANPATDAPTTPPNAPLAQGERTTLPGDDEPIDFDSSNLTTEQIEELEKEVLPNARAIVDPRARARALEKVGALLTYVGRYDEAYDALIEAGQAALRVDTSRERDLRLERIIRNLMALTAELLREAVPDLAPIPIAEDEETSKVDRLQIIDLILKIGEEASTLIKAMTSPIYRNEGRLLIAEELSNRAREMFSPLNLGPERRPDLADDLDALIERGDRIIQLAFDIALQTEWPLFRDNAKLEVVRNAARSERFTLAFELARAIAGPEARSEAYLALADVLARSRTQEAHADLATQAFSEAARAIASLPLGDVRNVLARALVDVLVAVGRFEDARAAVVLLDGDLYNIAQALGAVAESMGRRNLVKAAQEWIAEVENDRLRSYLERRLIEGVLSAINSSRGLNVEALGGMTP